jgi:hypothetical protein
MVLVFVQIILYLVVLATALPVGLFLAWLCEDELVNDRKYFLLFSYFLLIVSIILFFFYFKLGIILAILYTIIILWILIRRGRRMEKNIRMGKVKTSKTKFKKK